ncbi:hypothetical protein RHMOL_Rhmol08G0167200 [Rhododendron molle]|uniref:Uncharacterized protein n=1 Tax=Rhododendron molle TaxID=49168 RepID=A0ACC0MQM7_RHOML|nr:hypothetical protein RHMOL_Rhmol08G0167200 [Rhododendron molle]
MKRRKFEVKVRCFIVSDRSWIGGAKLRLYIDFSCLECNFMNFSRNVRCLKCKLEGPKRVSIDDVEMKKGDWNCPQCSFMNFASNRKCLRCREARPKRQLNPGEWECPSCDFLNYRRNVVCLKCNCERTSEVATRYEEQTWRSRN